MIRPNYFVSAYLEALQEYNADAVKGNDTPERYEAALNALSAVAADVAKDLGKWAVLNPAQRSPDANLLTGEYGRLTVDELQWLADKHRENYTMLRILSTYIGNEYGDSSGIHLVTVDGKRTAYAQIHDKAVEMAEQIHAAPVADSVLDEWMNPETESALYREIGGAVYPNL